MSIVELGFQQTPLGDLTLRRRSEPLLGGEEVYEIKLGDEYLMSSLFTESERRLAQLGLQGLGDRLDVIVGGLGLGYTAAEVLKHSNVERVLVIDIFQAVIDWHQAGLVPLGEILTKDARCELRRGDFFELAAASLDRSDPNRRFDAVLLDIDHSPEHFLNEDSGGFYTLEGFEGIRRQLKPGGCFALWSDDPSKKVFIDRLEQAFGSATAHDVEFPNPYTSSTSVNSVYVAENLK